MVLVLVLVLQVDLESPKKISGIITQGAKDFGSVQFVSAFKVAHSDDGRSWTIVKDQSTRTDKVRTVFGPVIPVSGDHNHQLTASQPGSGVLIGSTVSHCWEVKTEGKM